MDEELGEGLVVPDEVSVASTKVQERIRKDIKGISDNKWLLLLLGVIVGLVLLSGFYGYNLGWQHSNAECNVLLSECNDNFVPSFISWENQTEEVKEVIKEVEVEKIVYVNNTIKECDVSYLENKNTTIRIIKELKACQYRLAFINKTDCSYTIDKLNSSLESCESYLRNYKEISDDYVWKINST